MKRLRQCLHENDNRYDKSMDVGDAKSRIDKMTYTLEKKALRSCMVAKLYIRSMLTIIEDIKKNGIVMNTTSSTSSRHSRAHHHSPSSQHKRSRDNATHSRSSFHSFSQTPCTTDNMISSNSRSQSEPPEHMIQMKIPTIDEIRASEERQEARYCSNVIPFLSAQDLDDVSSILDSLPLNFGQQPLATSSLCGDKSKGELDFAPSISLDQRLEQMKHVLPVASSDPQSLEISSTNTSQDSLFISPLKRKHEKSVRQKRKLKVSNVSELAKKRLSEVVLEDEQALFQARVALVFKLEQELQVLPLPQRSSLENLYTRLFGPGHNYYLELSEEKQSDVTRKRIASLVVAELEPYYAGDPKRIDNKNLFKCVAKYLTELIYTINVCPDAEEVHEKVVELFMDGRSITCESDIYME